MNPANPIPHDGAIPLNPFVTGGYAELLLLLSLVSVLPLFIMALWAFWNENRRRERLFCPVRRRRARVVFHLAPGGRPDDVLRCAVFGRRPITCGKACLQGRAAA